MSTTNPEGGVPDPVPALAPREPGAPQPDEPTQVPVDPATISRGHEEDRYDSRAVFSVPLLVVLFFVLAFGTVSVIFYFIAYPGPTPGAHPQAVDRNMEPLNERLARYGRGSKDVNQPRLEDLKMRTGDPRAMTEPATPTGNSPWLRSEDLVPSEKNTPALYRFGWLDPGKTAARIPIDDAMKIALEKNLLPTQETTSQPLKPWNHPTAANAGRGFGASAAVPPALPAPRETKAPDKPPGEKNKTPEGKKK